MKTNIQYFNEDWKVLGQFFPRGWKKQAKTLGAMTRQRSISSVNKLLQLLLIHLSDGYSLRETVAIAKSGGITDISDVSLLKRLKNSAEWFRWMSLELLERKGIDMTVPRWLSGYNVKSIDASVITEPGSTGTDWRLHYSIYLFGLQCDQFIITQPNVGESFVNFKVNPGDLFIGDRAYGRFKSLKYVKDNGGDYIVRFKNKAFSLYCNKEEFKVVEELKSLRVGQVKEWSLIAVTNGGSELNLRLCAIKKNRKTAENSIKKAKKEASKKQKTIDPETLELHKYVIILTSIKQDISAKLILELYRCRWQVEIAFKRLKSILGLGHLPKTDPQSCRAWLHGKMFVALLAQAIVDEGRLFSPWGYPLS